jgi:hypothetical protein
MTAAESKQSIISYCQLKGSFSAKDLDVLEFKLKHLKETSAMEAALEERAKVYEEILNQKMI